MQEDQSKKFPEDEGSQANSEGLSEVSGVDFRDEDTEDSRDRHLQSSFMSELELALEETNKTVVDELICPLHAADVADVLESLSYKNRGTLVDILAEGLDPEVLTEIAGEAREQVLDQLSNEQIAEAVLGLQSDDAVDVLEDLDQGDRDEVLANLEDQERKAFEKALGYPEDSAGRLMQTDFLALPEFWTVGQTIDLLRERDDELPVDFYDVFVVDPRHTPVGKVPVSRILRSKRDKTLAGIMMTDPHLVDPFSDQEEVAYQFSKYHLISAAVVDQSKRLLGVITVDDVVNVIGEEAGEDILALAGVSDEGINESLGDIAKGRFSWLFVNLGTAILASLVIGFFDATIEQMVALAVLMPIVASMGGNAGTQTMTVAVRGLATKELSTINASRILKREMKIALINGVGLSLLSGVVAFLWFNQLALGVVFSIAMIFNLFIASLAGLLVPFGLSRVGIDPAISSSVFVTTITDIVGFFVFLGLAGLIL